jgi:alkylated DNA repair dioxygenase AlkB
MNGLGDRLKRDRELSPPLSAQSRLDATELKHDDEDTDLKLAILQSLLPHTDQQHILEVLISCNGSVEETVCQLQPTNLKESSTSPVKRPRSESLATQQTSLASFVVPLGDPAGQKSKKMRPLTKKGQTLFLYSPEDVERNTPCSIIHNFLPAAEASSLLSEILEDCSSYEVSTFKLFDNIVQSPHTSAMYVDGLDEVENQQRDYIYNGARLTDVRELLPNMQSVKQKVQQAVNSEIQRRIKNSLEGKKLRFQDPNEWVPNAAFVNCYDGASQSVGWHSDQLTYLGPRAVIGSISLGVAREFRVRRVVARDVRTEGISESGATNGTAPGAVKSYKELAEAADKARADAEGQISIHLPHNSLLVMHAEMQEDWKHSIHPALTITPHPIAGNKRINITYRYYKEQFHPKYTPRCQCGVAAVMRVVQRKSENKGKYFWMCHSGNVPQKERDGCGFFKWAEFDEDGNPLGLEEWKGRLKGPP